MKKNFINCILSMLVIWGLSGANVAEAKVVQTMPIIKTETPIIIMDKLTVVQPVKDATVYSPVKGYNFFGSCDPKKELYINNQLIQNVTKEGFYSIYITLNKGENIFKLSQEGQETITRKIILKDSLTTKSTKTPIQIQNIAADTPYYATVKVDSAWVYPNHTDVGGSSWQLSKGQTDKIIAVTEDEKWYKLSSGVWIYESNITSTYQDQITTNVLSNGTYENSSYLDRIKWKSNQFAAANVTFDGKALTIYFGMQNVVPELDIAELKGLESTVFSEVVKGKLDSTPYYKFTIKEGTRLEGFYLSHSDGEFSLNIKKRKTLSQKEKPLEGFTFVIDAGHGKDDNGAKGPMGAALAEKHINLSNALKLRDRLTKLGATVTMVRDTDIFYTLQERTEISRRVNPDMFISIHANSVHETTDATNINGMTLWYRNPNSQPIASLLTTKLYKINPITTRKEEVNQANYYVCRPSWTPSIIIETSFICNINDFVWLIDENKQNELADAIVGGILEYYK